MLAKFELPKSLSKKRKQELLGQPHTHKPDCDNLEKIYFDALKGLLYKDDAQIAMSLTRKVWWKDSGVSIFVGNIDVYYEVLMDHFMMCTMCKKIIPVNEIGICLGCQTGTPNLYEEMLLNKAKILREQHQKNIDEKLKADMQTALKDTENFVNQRVGIISNALESEIEQTQKSLQDN